MEQGLDDIKSLYRKLVSKAQATLRKNNFNSCMMYIDAAANLAYNYNWIFADSSLEKMIHVLASNMLNINQNIFQTKKYIFYDAFSMDNRGLTQQYIRALMDNNITFLYITENVFIDETDIYQEVKNYTHADLCIVPANLNRASKVKFIYNTILRYESSGIFMHIKPWSVEALVAFAAFPRIVKYNINLTDHAFWLGSSVLNYNIEFRNYGCSLSVCKRGLTDQQILLLPYYPIQNKIAFEGFPIPKKKGDVFLFAGANLYKIYGNNDEFLRTIKTLLDAYPNTYFFYAGGGDATHFNFFVEQEKLVGRVFYLGFRKDINQLVRNIDIYIDTFPVSGGLMGEYAIVNKKPILAYIREQNVHESDDDTLASLFDSGKLQVFYNKEKLLEYAGKLILDENFRKYEGEKNFNLVPTRMLFGVNVFKMLTKRESPFKIQWGSYAYDKVVLKYLEINKSTRLPMVGLIKILRFRILLISPMCLFKGIPFLLTTSGFTMLKRYIARKMKSRIIK